MEWHLLPGFLQCPRQGHCQAEREKEREERKTEIISAKCQTAGAEPGCPQARIAPTYRTDRNAVLGKHREQRGCLLLCEHSYLENYPMLSLWTGVFCRLIRTKIHPFLCLLSAPTPPFLSHALVLSPRPCCCQQTPSSSTKPSGVTVKWHKNKTDRKVHFLKALVF